MATRKVMQLQDARTGRMQCRVCLSVHYAQIRTQSSGQYHRGSWQCANGCRLPTVDTPQP